MLDELLRDLKQAYIGSSDRLQHIYGVKNTAIKLAKIHDVPISKVIWAAYLHDFTKPMSTTEHIKMLKDHDLSDVLKAFTPPLYHAYTAAIVAKEIYHVEDEDVLNAIKYHTVGRPNMSLLEKILFISDYIEPSRHYTSCVMVREIALNDLDYGVYLAIDYSIKYFESLGGKIPDIAYEARRFYQDKGGFHE